MKINQHVKTLGASAALVALVLALSNTSHVNAESENSLARIGLRVAPVPLDLNGKDPDLVGWGSYIVNVTRLQWMPLFRSRNRICSRRQPVFFSDAGEGEPRQLPRWRP